MISAIDRLASELSKLSDADWLRLAQRNQDTAPGQAPNADPAHGEVPGGMTEESDA